MESYKGEDTRVSQGGAESLEGGREGQSKLVQEMKTHICHKVVTFLSNMYTGR